MFSHLKFVFNTTPSAKNIDLITDFSHGTDHIQLALATFAGLGSKTGALASKVFASGYDLTQARTSSEHILYDAHTGILFYDADGLGGTLAQPFATLLGVPAVSAGDFVLG